MAYTNATRRTRAAVREAALVSRRGKLDEARANLRDLNSFFDATHQLASVDLWLDSKLADLHARAEARRTECRAKAGAALADMRDRGLTVGEIARMSGMPEETLRGYMDETS
ncbi:hypothetical protein MCEMAEM6B_00270 [Mycobacteriaceae bacterium]